MAQYDNFDYAADAARPVYKASYEDELKKAYDSISQRESFSYDAADDPLYRKYRDDYIRQGQLAMKDSMGQAAALTGGYGSSYAQSAAQQQYDAHLEKLGDIIPELYQLAYSRYEGEGEALKDRYDALSKLRDDEYSGYLQELRAARNMPPYEEGQVDAYLREKAHLVDERRVTVTHAVSDELWRDFVWMTPLMQDLSAEEKNEIAAKNAGHVTVDLHVAACRLIIQ